VLCELQRPLLRQSWGLWVWRVSLFIISRVTFRFQRFFFLFVFHFGTLLWHRVSLAILLSLFFFLLLYANSFFEIRRNSDLENSPTRISMNTLLRKAWEVLNYLINYSFSSSSSSSLSLIYFNLFTFHEVFFNCIYITAASALELQRNIGSSSAMIGRNMNEYAYFTIPSNPYHNKQNSKRIGFPFTHILFRLLIHYSCVWLNLFFRKK